MCTGRPVLRLTCTVWPYCSVTAVQLFQMIESVCKIHSVTEVDTNVLKKLVSSFCYIGSINNKAKNEHQMACIVCVCVLFAVEIQGDTKKRQLLKNPTKIEEIQEKKFDRN